MSYEKIFAVRQEKKRQIWDRFSNKENYPQSPTQFITLVVKKAQALFEQYIEEYRRYKQTSSPVFKKVCIRN
jgi:hypothetical protein